MRQGEGWGVLGTLRRIRRMRAIERRYRPRRDAFEVIGYVVIALAGVLAMVAAAVWLAFAHYAG